MNDKAVVDDAPAILPTPPGKVAHEIAAAHRIVRAAATNPSALDPAQLEQFNKFMQWYVPEGFMQPSDKPGEHGHPGASPKQLNLIAEFERHRHRVYAAVGANRSGKTISVAIALARYIRDHAQDGDVFWIIAATNQTLRDIPCKMLWQMIPRPMWGKTEYNPSVGFGSSHVAVLTLPDRRGKVELWLWSEDVELNVIESAGIKGVWWTECYREAIFGALMPRIAKSAGWMLMDYVPRQPWHRTRIRLAAKTNPDILFTQFAMCDNAHNLPEGELERQERMMSADEWRMRGLGFEAMMEGVVYPQFKEDLHVIPRFRVPPTWPRWRFLDYGFGAPTAVGWGTVAPVGWTPPGRDKPLEQETKIVYQEYYERGRSISQNAAAVHARSKGEKYVTPMLIDPAAHNMTASNQKSIAQQYAQEGLHCRSWPKTNVYGEDALVEIVRKHLDDGALLVCDNCPNAISEFQSWSYKKDREGKVNPMERYEPKNNHLLDGIRGWVATSPSHTIRKLSVNYTGD